MMNLRIRNILLLVFHTLAFGLLFFPSRCSPMYNLDLGWTTLLYGDECVRNIVPLAFIQLVDQFELTPWSGALAIVIIILYCVMLIALFLQLIGKTDRQQNSIFALVLSIVNLFSFFWYSYFLTKTVRYEWGALELGGLFLVELLLQAAFVIFYVITYVLSRRNCASSCAAIDTSA